MEYVKVILALVLISVDGMFGEQVSVFLSKIIELFDSYNHPRQIKHPSYLVLRSLILRVNLKAITPKEK